MDLDEFIYENKKQLNQKEEFIKEFGSKLYREKEKNGFDGVVFLCVGTDKIIGDSLRTTCWK